MNKRGLLGKLVLIAGIVIILAGITYFSVSKGNIQFATESVAVNIDYNTTEDDVAQSPPDSPTPGLTDDEPVFSETVTATKTSEKKIVEVDETTEEPINKTETNDTVAE